jgi:hypothetical protein
MATPGMPPTPDQQGAGGPPSGGPPSSAQMPTQGGSPSGAPSQGPANQIQQLLGNWSTVAQQISQAYPQIASQMNKIVQAIGEAQTAMVTPPQPTPTAQQPMMG